MQVQQIMNQPPIICHAYDMCDRAAKLMGENDCGAIPVINEHKRVIGMITDRDICMVAYNKRSPIHTILIKDAMTQNVSTCRPEDSLETAASLMQKAQVHRLPVVDYDHHIVGVISTNDIFREVSAHGEEDTMSDRKLVEALAAICAPHRPVQLTKQPH